MEKLNRIVEGSQEWITRIMGENSTAGERMYSSESYFDAFWEDAAHGVAIISEDGIVVDANPAFCHLLDIHYEQAIGLSIKDFVADGQWRDDMRTIDTIALGKQHSITTEERWNKRLNTTGPFIPVRVRAIRIPAERTRPFKHIILHVYDLRSTRYDMQGNNWSNKKMPELFKELLMTHFGKISAIILALIFCMALNGNLGDAISKVIDNVGTWLKHDKVQYIQVPQNLQQDKNPPIEDKQ